MKILLTGKNGQVGHELQSTLMGLGEVTAVSSAECDFRNGAALRDMVRAVAPGVIVNPAAYTAVDRAETHRADAMLINAKAPAILAEEAARLDAILIHFSTDYVFDGTKAAPYLEDDEPAPLNAYGESKLEGEIAVRQACGKHFILRTSWVTGAHGHNFLKTMLRLATERDRLEVVADQWGAPTAARHLAELVAKLVSLAIRGTGAPYGTYHATAGGETNWFELARHAIARARAAGLTVRTSADSIHPITTDQYNTPAKRPLNSRLDCDKLRRATGLQMPDWHEGIDQTLDQIIGKT